MRATHLNDYIAVLREIGAPVDRDLARSPLPSGIEETPDLYVNIPTAIEWVARTGHDLNPMELGFLASQKASLASLRPAQQAVLMIAQTGLKRLEALADLSRYENSALQMSIRHEGDVVRVICSMSELNRHVFICLAEWLNLQAIISVIRSVAGAAWCPGELSFVSKGCPPEAVYEAFPNTRILLGQSHTSVSVARADLARPTFDVIPTTRNTLASLSTKDGQSGWEFISLLRVMVQPYLNDGGIDVAIAAEMAGISTRTLQRKLKLSGSSYSQLVREARFELARTHLAEPEMKVIDIAMLAGYENPQHFSRAFRRFTGLTPSQYRKQRVQDASRLNQSIV